MERLKSGNTQCLALLYERYYKNLFGFFYRMSGGKRDVSEDLVHNVFERILKYSHTYKEGSQFTYWMFHLARNVFSDQFKKQNPLYQSRELTAARDLHNGSLQLDQIVEKQEEVDMLQQALDQLGEEDREFIVLSRYQYMRYKEIGKLKNISEGAVKVRIHRAIQKLKNHYVLLSKESNYGT